MGWPKNLPAAALALMLVASGVGYFLTRDSEATRPAPKTAGQASLMDQRLLQTARQMASTAETPEERAFAAEVARLADHELDQAFATALREASGAAAALTGPLQQLAARAGQLRTRVARDQDRVNQLTKTDPDGSALDLAKAQLALDQDELDDAQDDLARQGGDPHASIERALQEHEAAQKIALEPARPAQTQWEDTFSGELRAWLALGDRTRQAEAARQQAAGKAATLERQHDGLEKSRRPVDADATDEEEDTAAVVERLRKLSDQTKTMRELDTRMQDSQQLAGVYQKWEAELETRRKSAAHDLLRSSALIFAVLLAAVIAMGGIKRGLRMHTDRRRAQQLRFMTTLAVQLTAAAVVLLIVFGPPTQLSTIIGLVTAGLTVVLKDFIVAFLGWFILMGRNGIRVGDWVEIQGVSGEVVAIGVFRTVLLETGKSTTTGHPTGRRAAFMNSFAIEGHYFNFSTAGQWLWDEVRIAVPAGGDPYRMAEEIRETVERATEPDAEEAARDWERVTRQYGTRPFSARPAVDLRPTGGGLEVVIRYITRAPQREERKSQLYQEIVALLHRGRPGAPNATV
jgi:small-conductance mechanosensitive channel